MKKERLDKYLVDLGYFETKSKASSAILAGHVKINDEYITKAGFQISPDKEYEIEVKSMPYVSRGGFKLKKLLIHFLLKFQAGFVLTPVPPQGDLLIAFYRTELNLFMLSMSDTANWIGKYALIKELKQLRELI